MLRIHMVIIELAPILFTLPTSCIRAIIGERERRIITQCGNQMSTALSDHLPGSVMAKGTIKDKVDHLEAIADQLQ